MTKSQKILLLGCSATSINQNYKFDQRGSWAPNPSKLYPGYLRIVTGKYVPAYWYTTEDYCHLLKQEVLSEKVTTGTHPHICLWQQLTTHATWRRRTQIWGKCAVGFFFSSLGSEILFTVEKEILFSLKTSIKIDLHNKDNVFIFPFQLKYYLVSAEVLIF